jgi:hypothetical protein
VRDQNSTRANSSGGGSGFTTRVASSNNDDIVAYRHSSLCELITPTNRNVSRETLFTQAETPKNLVQKIIVANNTDHLV